MITSSAQTLDGGLALCAWFATISQETAVPVQPAVGEHLIGFPEHSISGGRQGQTLTEQWRRGGETVFIQHPGGNTAQGGQQFPNKGLVDTTGLGGVFCPGTVFYTVAVGGYF